MAVLNVDEHPIASFYMTFNSSDIWMLKYLRKWVFLIFLIFLFKITMFKNIYQALDISQGIRLQWVNKQYFSKKQYITRGMFHIHSSKCPFREWKDWKTSLKNWHLIVVIKKHLRSLLCKQTNIVPDFKAGPGHFMNFQASFCSDAKSQI